jgi:hypothetical protein
MSVAPVTHVHHAEAAEDAESHLSSCHVDALEKA